MTPATRATLEAGALGAWCAAITFVPTPQAAMLIIGTSGLAVFWIASYKLHRHYADMEQRRREQEAESRMTLYPRERAA